MLAQPLTLRPVILHGRLAEGIGRKIDLAFRSPGDALRLLEANFPGFLSRFKTGLFYVSVVRDGEEIDLTENRLNLGTSADELHIMPRLIGARKGKGLITAIVGGLMIGAAYFFSGGAAGAVLPGFLGATGATYGSLATMGLGLVLQGVGIMLTPGVKAPSKAEQEQSFVFDGPINVMDQGGVVPVVYGKHMIGSTTVSATIDNESRNGMAPGMNLGTPLNPRVSLGRGILSISLTVGNFMDKPSAAARITKVDGVSIPIPGTFTKVTGGRTLTIISHEGSTPQSISVSIPQNITAGNNNYAIFTMTVSNGEQTKESRLTVAMNAKRGDDD